MRILINATSVKMGGALTYITNLVGWIAQNEKKYRFIIALPETLLSDYHDTQHLRVLRIPKQICDSAVRLFWWQQIAVPRIIKNYNADLLFSTANFATFFSPCTQVVYIRIPHYFSSLYQKYVLPRKRLGEKINFFFRKLLIIISAQCPRHVLVQTESMKQNVVRVTHIKSSKIHIIPFGTQPIAQYNQPRAIGNKCIELLCTSHYADYKNYTTLLKALVILESRGCHFRFTAPLTLSLPLFQGLPSLQEDKALIETLELKNKLNLTGIVPYDQILTFYQKADIFLWPTLAESFGNPLIEAMATGLPIICSDIPVNHEICANAALYCDPLDPHVFADAIQRLSREQTLYNNLCAASFARAQHFSWGSHITQLLEFFEHAHAQRLNSDSSV